MRKGITAAALAGAVAALSVLAGSALAGTAHSSKSVTFSGKYAGKAVVRVTNDVAEISATGSGTSNVIGKGKITGKGTGDSSKRPCVPFGGTGKLTGPKGTLSFKVTSGGKGCGDEAGAVFSIVGRIAVVKGTGKLAKARGSLKFTGVYDRGEGTFSVKFTGSLTV